MRVNQTLTVASGTPINVATGMTAAQLAAAGYGPVGGPFNIPDKWAKRVFIQMLHGGSGLGYVMDGIRGGRIPASTSAGDVTAELAPASSTSPGGVYSDFDANPYAGINLAITWIDGSNSGDTVKTSWDQMV